ncbi:divisome protein SepX/GlpR [Nakamurella leprariae]|uniref:Transmembrane protein n=1 Tax=Nakamurella leprariae TaxID=2803911 RepID=A0A938YBA8_9ACTN|nr:gephyrin-like molybdotransferase receptor GlpR [Nakamurella leprariae]MBM9467462.1 hypothetical protein [Nakamurella leprariae]
MNVPTSLIVVVLVIAWLVVLVPMVAKSRDRVPRVRSEGRGFRVLQRSTTGELTTPSRRRRAVGSSPARRGSGDHEAFSNEEALVTVGSSSHPADAAEEWEAVQATASQRRPQTSASEYEAQDEVDAADSEPEEHAIRRARPGRSNWFNWTRRGEAIGPDETELRAEQERLEAERAGYAQYVPEFQPVEAHGSHPYDPSVHQDEAATVSTEQWYDEAERPGPAAPRLADEDHNDLTEFETGRAGAAYTAAEDDRLRPVPRRAGRGGFDPEAAAAAKAYKYAQRRKVALSLLVATVLFAVLAAVVASVLWAGAAIAGLLLVAYMVYLRRQVKIEESIRQRRLARLQRARQIRPEFQTEDEAYVAEPEYAPRPVAVARDEDAGAARPAARLHRTRQIVDLDDDDPAFDDLEYYDPTEYRRAVGQ